jgi:hypothetical protein
MFGKTPDSFHLYIIVEDRKAAAFCQAAIPNLTIKG